MQWAKSSTSVVDLQLREEPACVKKAPREVLEKPVLWRPSGSGTAPTVPRVGASQVLRNGGREGGREVPCLCGVSHWGTALFVLTGAHQKLLPPPDQPRLGLVSQRRVGIAPTRHPSYSLPLSRLFVGSGPLGFQP